MRRVEFDGLCVRLDCARGICERLVRRAHRKHQVGGRCVERRYAFVSAQRVGESLRGREHLAAHEIDARDIGRMDDRFIEPGERGIVSAALQFEYAKAQQNVGVAWPDAENALIKIARRGEIACEMPLPGCRENLIDLHAAPRCVMRNIPRAYLRSCAMISRHWGSRDSPCYSL